MAIDSIAVKNPMADSVEITFTDLSSDNEISYDSKKEQILVIKNGSGSSYTPVLTGSSASSAYFASGVGEVDLSAGKTLGVIADGEQFAFTLKSADRWLQGAVTLTPATASVEAAIIEV